MKISYFTISSTGFILGVLGWIFTIPFLLLFLLLRKTYFREVFLFILFIFLGSIFVHTWDQRIQKDLDEFTGKNEITGEVVESIGRKIDSGQYVVKIDQANTKVIVSNYNAEIKLEVGDRVKAEGPVRSLERLDEGYKGYLESKNIHYQQTASSITVVGRNKFSNLFYKLNQFVSAKLESNLDFEIANFNAGLLIGKDPVLTQSVEDNVKNLGLTHILSASGFNIGLVYILLNSILQFDIKKKRILIVLFVWIYTLIIGLESIGTVRASLMLTYVLLSLNQGRKYHFHNSILFSCLVILLIYPYYYLNVSFQLSIAATIGIFYISKPIKNAFSSISEQKIIVEPVSLTIAALFATYPIIYHHFGATQPGNLLANLLVVPVVPILTIYSFFLVIFTTLEISVVSDFLGITISGITKITFMILKQIQLLGFLRSSIALFLAMFILQHVDQKYKDFVSSRNN